jgi:hypothetical protein
MNAITKNITVGELVALFLGMKGANFITATFVTSPSMRKTGNPFANVARKRVTVNGMVNFHYDDGVIRRLAKEGKSPADFAQGTSWHTPVLRADGSLTPLATNKSDPTKFYLRFMHLANVVEAAYFDTRDNSPINTDKIKPFLSEKSSYENQGLEKPLIFLIYGLTTIESITFDGATYSVLQPQQVPVAV